MSNLSSFYSVHKYDNLNLTCQDISAWFNENYNVNITFDMSNVVNEGSSELPSGPSSTAEIIDALSSDEIARIESFDNIDKAIYDQVV